MFVKLLEDAFDGARVGNVPGRCEGLTARLGDEADRGFRALRHDVVDRDPHAFACEQLGGGLADALSGSCHQGTLALPTLIVTLLIESCDMHGFLPRDSPAPIRRFIMQV